jgi:hypothetical protein
MIRRFGSLFGRINSLFGHLGKSIGNPLNFRPVAAVRPPPIGEFHSFFPSSKEVRPLH